MEKYERVEIKTTEFDAEDVITTSNYETREYEIQQFVPIAPNTRSAWW